MKLKFGITGKLVVLYLFFFLIFFGTILYLQTCIHQMMKTSAVIVNKNYKIASASRRMIENLLDMEENEKKYRLLERDDYLEYFNASRREFEEDLAGILGLEKRGMTVSSGWKALNAAYREYCGAPACGSQGPASGGQWIPERVIDGWIREIATARSENERDVETANRELDLRGRMAVKSGLAGLGVSIVAGLLGSIFLAHSMIRPLRELLAGIRSVSGQKRTRPIRISAMDEFGEVADAFNEMTVQLKEEKRLRSDFVSMMSHEIRTPLTSIRESVNLIGEGIMGEINQRQRKFLEIANLEIERVANLLNRLMQSAAMTSGAIRIKPSPQEVFGLVHGYVERSNAAAASRGIVLSAVVPRAHPKVLGDPSYLEQVFLNLVGNAIKFSDAGGRIVVSAEPSEERQMARFSVSDSGPGIPEEEQALIFNKYYRARKVRDQMDGVGLGLSICKHIVEAHGGTLWVESTPGAGAAFHFTLPTVPGRSTS